MPAGYSPNPLYKKLGLKEGFSVKLVHPPANYATLIHPLMDHIIIAKKNTDLDFIHFFTNDAAELGTQLPLLMKEIKKAGTIWISWYKGSAKKPTTVNEQLIRAIALPLGLVDVKVCAVDDDWSGLKLVYRLENR
ncbi:DUF3052 family protein [Chitinophaga vietnamensis]|uniref:DUF3052 family protein n=1 Tax=Chitinophaga vietnamensis TaxID=2593957 RepID=UPI0011784EF7|nr:DUF3052 family protein [Chitinophaga vietnamensis]